MIHAALEPLIGREFDDFLGASVGEDPNGTSLTVLSALARLDVDPWQEATNLARIPREAAVARMSALIDALPHGPGSAIPSMTRAADLVALLPRPKKLKARSPENGSGAVGARQNHIFVGSTVVAVAILFVLAIKVLYAPNLGTSPNPLAPRADAATSTMPRPGAAPIR